MFIVEYPDGTRHKIVYPRIKLDGTIMGDRTLKFKGKLYVIDEKNDIMSFIHLDPDKRNFFKKITSKKKTTPDYFRYNFTKKLKNLKKKIIKTIKLY